MATNPFDEYLDKLLDHLNMLNGFLSTLNEQLTNFRNLCNQYIEEGKLEKSKLVSGSSLVIRDLTEWPANGWAICYPSGKFVTQGEEYINMIETLISRESSWTISQAYEAFETFLKDITASYLLLHQVHKDVISQNLSNFNKYLEKQKKGLSSTTFQYWRDFIDRCYKANTKILELLRTIAPDIQKVEKKNNRAIDLTQWFEVATEVRHAVTHSSSLIKNEKMYNWTPNARLLLTNHFHGTYRQGGYILYSTMANAKECLTILAEYAYTIYKNLSELNSYDWYDILLKKRSQ